MLIEHYYNQKKQRPTTIKKDDPLLYKQNDEQKEQSYKNISQISLNEMKQVIIELHQYKKIIIKQYQNGQITNNEMNNTIKTLIQCWKQAIEITHINTGHPINPDHQEENNNPSGVKPFLEWIESMRQQ